MERCELRKGYSIETRDGQIWLIIFAYVGRPEGRILQAVSIDGEIINIDDYSEDLYYFSNGRNLREYDIMSVYDEPEKYGTISSSQRTYGQVCTQSLQCKALWTRGAEPT